MNAAPINRRRLLQSGTAVGLALSLPPGLTGAARAATSVALQVILLAGDAAPDTVREAIRVLVDNGVPVGLSLTPAAAAAGVETARADALVEAGDIARLPPYFQARRLSELRRALKAALPEGETLHGVVAPDPGGALDLGGLGAPRLVNAFLIPGEPTPAWVETLSNQVTVARGGFVVRAGAADAARAYLVEVLSTPEQFLATLYIELAGAPNAVIDTVTEIAYSVGWEVSVGRLVPLAPSELGARFSEDFRRLVGLRLDPPPPGAEAEGNAALLALTAALDAATIAYSVARDDPGGATASDCLRLGPDPDIAGLPRGLTCVMVPPSDTTSAPALAEAGTLAALEAAEPGFVGLDGDGLLHLPSGVTVTDAEGVTRFAATLPLTTTAILALDAEALASPAQRNGAVAGLRRLIAIPGTRIVNIAYLARLILPPDPVFDTMRQTRIAAPALVARTTAKVSASGRVSLLQDAARAWGYFETVTVARTGLPAATVAFNPDGTPGVEHRVLTQWDVGSALFAQVAARKLGLIDADTFLAHRDAHIAALQQATLRKVRLPRALFDITNPASGSTEFNMCDTARLLSALKAVEAASPAGDTAVRDLVASWDLAAATTDGVPHSYDGRIFYPLPPTHCTNYVARTLALWGITAISQYDTYYQGETETDRQMYLLETIAETGALGAEPLLLEGLELGFDAPTGYLRDVLLAAQIAETAASGNLIAPSESPLDRAPWFSYQGLRVDYDGPTRWDVTMISDDARYQTDEYRVENRVIPTKAAFLWAATHPHPYSGRLLAYARAHGRLPTGFASAIYTATDTPTVDYGDVNTNGIILEAIAALLRG